MRYAREAQAAARDRDVPRLNPQQRSVYQDVMAAVERSREGQGGQAFFVDGLGGAGKTFLYGCMLSSVRAGGGIALSVASSGIAALLLEGGRTAHSRFKIPVGGDLETATCYINRQSPLADLIQAADLIVWDEAPMMHRHVFETVNRSLQDIMVVLDPSNATKVFGGKVVVMGGDFRQILPVVPKASRGQVVAACLNRSSAIWPHVQVAQLHTNMRVLRLREEGGAGGEAAAAAMQGFADMLQRIGEGTEQVYPTHGEDCIRIPPEMCCKGGQDACIGDLIEEVYGELIGAGPGVADPAARSRYIIERAILTPLNVDVDAVNKMVGERVTLPDPVTGLPGEKVTYLSVDSVVEGEQAGTYPLEFLNSLSFSGVPPHELPLQVGSPIILLRNMAGGLANGTRMIVTKLMPHVIEAEVATGPKAGERVCIPRLSITPSDVENMPFTLRRRQYPVRAAFAMTVNKSQGQTLKRVGIYLPKSVFSHGQLYVAMSRVGSKEGVCVLVLNGWREAVQDSELGDAPEGVYTRNVVYKEVFTP